jgi:hypothetical protein
VYRRGELPIDREGRYIIRLPIQQEVLPPENPDTLMSMSNIADILQDQHQWKRALDLHRKVLKGRQRALGFEHPDTSTSAVKVFTTLLKSGQQPSFAMNFLRSELAWLLDRDPATLGVDQRAIRELVAFALNQNKQKKP